MYRLSEDLAREILKRIKNPEVVSSGNEAYTFKSKNSIGIIDPHAALGIDFHYSIEFPFPIIFPEVPYIKNGVDGFYLYKREELMQPMEPWFITKVLVDPNTTDYQAQIDVRDCAVILPSNIDKLITSPVNTMEQLLAKEPLLADCLNLEKK